MTTPFPVTEAILCYFSTHIACQSISPQTIKVYLAGIWHVLIFIGLPNPKKITSMPCLCIVQSGIQCYVTPKSQAIRLNIFLIKIIQKTNSSSSHTTSLYQVQMTLEATFLTGWWGDWQSYL